MTKRPFASSAITRATHTGDGVAELALLYVRELPGSKFAPAMTIVDVNNELLLGDVMSPPRLSTFMDGYALRADVLFPAGPDGQLYPGFTPGYGDSNSAVATRWGRGCLFRAGVMSSDCGPGFIRVSLDAETLPYGATMWFREAFGHVADIDEDGWEDLHLPYHSAFVPISGHTGADLATTSYDVAATTGAQPLMFHAGRHYGVHHAVRNETTGPWPMRRTVLVVGSPVGDFDNPMCNVSRYTAVLIQDGAPSTRRLAWADFDDTTPAAGTRGLGFRRVATLPSRRDGAISRTNVYTATRTHARSRTARTSCS